MYMWLKPYGEGALLQTILSFNTKKKKKNLSVRVDE